MSLQESIAFMGTMTDPIHGMQADLSLLKDLAVAIGNDMSAMQDSL